MSTQPDARDTTDDELQLALESANIPTLLMTVAHLTGDHSWLEPPYRPTRTVALDDHDTGGLSPERQAEVREAVLAVLRLEREGTLPTPQPPTDQQIVEMLSVAMGEAVPTEYGPMFAEEAGFRQRDVRWSQGSRPAAADGFRVLIIGAGLSGLCMAIKLKALGIEYDLVDKNDAIGGTWLENDYPGAGVDTPSHLYSFSFEPSSDWSRYFAKQPEILSYINGLAAKHEVVEDIRFGVEVIQTVWSAERNRWLVRLQDRNGTSEAEYRIVVSSVGQLNRPQIPRVPGLDSFGGPCFHSAEWDHSVDLDGRRVGVLGTGASAMQIVPAVAGRPANLTVFQRSPQWVTPNANYRRELSDGKLYLLQHVPYYATWYRIRLLWMYNDKLHATLRKDPDWDHPDRSINAANDKHRVFFTEHIRRELGDRTDLWDKVLPGYPPYGKRILIDNGWYQAIQRPDVELVTDPVERVEPGAMVTADGTRHELDVLVLATGFQSRRMLYPMDIRGRSGVSLHESWGDDDARAYLGLAVPEFPNLFILYGPNTNLGHGGSVIFHTECQVNYVTRLLVELIEHGLSTVEVRRDVFDDYNIRVDRAHSEMIWTHPGVDTWYRNAAGRVVTNTPWRLVDYWAMTRRPSLSDYLTSAEAEPSTPIAAGAGSGAGRR